MNDDARYTRADFEQILVDDHPRTKDHNNSREPVDLLVEVPLAAQALTLLNLERRDTYDSWLDVGFSLTELGDAGLALWEVWSKPSPTYEPGMCASKWPTMKPGKGITLASLYHWAAEDEGITLAPKHHASKPAEPHTLAQVIRVYQRHMYMPNAGHLIFDLSTIVANHFAGDAVWGLTVGPPGSGKTETMGGLAAMPDVFSVATLTVASLLSGTSKREKVAGAKGGLLREIGDFGILAIKDFGGILSMNRDARAELLAALREIFDGSWTRYVGTDGGKCLSWSGKIGLVGCATPSIDHAHSMMGTLGERFVFYRMPESEVPERAGAALKHSGNEIAMREDISKAVQGLMNTIEMPPIFVPVDPESEVGTWLIALASLAARCRSVVIRDGYRREVELIPGAEVPTRLVIVLAKLYRAAQVIGVSEAAARAMVYKVAFDSMPQLRRRVLELLLDHPNGMQTKSLAQTLGTPTNTVKIALEDLACYQVLVRDGSGPPVPDVWTPSEQTVENHTTIKAFLRSVGIPRNS